MDWAAECGNNSGDFYSDSYWNENNWTKVHATKTFFVSEGSCQVMNKSTASEKVQPVI